MVTGVTWLYSGGKYECADVVEEYGEFFRKAAEEVQCEAFVACFAWHGAD